MSTGSSIHNLDMLEKEIYRLQLEAAAKEKQLGENFDWVRHNASKVIIEELLCKRNRHHPKEEDAGNNNNKQERWKEFFNKMADKFADRAADGVENLIDKLFHRKKNHT